MFQSNALTVPFILALTSTSLSLAQPIAPIYHMPNNALEEDMYRTTTVGDSAGMYFNPINMKNAREQALQLFGHQSNLTAEERKLSDDALRKSSTDTGLNIFDMYKKRTIV